jgi:putative spermidine/putrescine transport system substrate-binding protein
MTNETKKHSIEKLSARASRGEISRRQFTQLAALVLAGTPILLRSTGAFAQIGRAHV